MPIPQNKVDLQQAIKSTYAKLKLDLQDIDPKQSQLQELPGHQKGTMMSPANLVAYLIGWGELVLKWHRQYEAQSAIDFPETGFQWNELGALAQKFYRDHDQKDFPSLLRHLELTVEKILALIDRYDDVVLYGQVFYKSYPLGRMIQLNTSSPYKNARTRIRKWKKEKQQK
ncbi:MAG: ClbS/DfsB family four-helix bundle protein [Bacteroidota bacterium]